MKKSLGGGSKTRWVWIHFSKLGSLKKKFRNMKKQLLFYSSLITFALRKASGSIERTGVDPKIHEFSWSKSGLADAQSNIKFTDSLACAQENPRSYCLSAWRIIHLKMVYRNILELHCLAWLVSRFSMENRKMSALSDARLIILTSGDFMKLNDQNSNRSTSREENWMVKVIWSARVAIRKNIGYFISIPETFQMEA